MRRNRVVTLFAVASVLALGLTACSSTKADTGDVKTKVLKVAFNQSKTHPQSA